MPGENTEYSGPVARDPLLGTEVPVYLGGEGPVETPTGDRGDDFVATSATLPQGSVAGALAAAAAAAPESPSSEPEVTEPEATERLRGPDGKFLSKAEIAAQSQEPSAQSQETQDAEADDEPRIPKARLDKEIQKRRALEAKLREKEQSEKAVEQASHQQYDFDAAEEEYMNLLLDGKVEEAKAKRSEIRKAERAEIEAIAVVKAKEVDERTTAAQAIDSISLDYEQRFPMFDSESDQFKPELVAEAEAIYLGYLNKGVYSDAVEAFEAALKAVVKINDLTPVGGAAKPQAAATRTAEGRVAAIKSTPPLTSQAGQSGASAGAAVVPDVSQLSEDQLAKLPLATLKRLRGDDV